MIPPDFQAVIIRLARMGRADAVEVVEHGLAQGQSPLTILLAGTDHMLARLRPLPLHREAKAAGGPVAARLPVAQPANEVAAPLPATACPEQAQRVEGSPAKHGADDAQRRAALRARMACAEPVERAAPQAAPEPSPEPQAAPVEAPVSEPEDQNPITVVEEPADKPVLQLPTVCNGGELYVDAIAMLANLGYGRAECRRMAKTAIEAGCRDLDAIVRCTTRASTTRR